MCTFSHNYESDITREQLELIRLELEGARKKTKPREIDMYSVFCAILYLVKGGIQWRIVVDTMGLLHGFLVTTADETDRNGATEMVGLHLDGLSQARKHVVDGGTAGKTLRRR